MRTPIKLRYGAAAAIATTVVLLAGASPASASPTTPAATTAVADRAASVSAAGEAADDVRPMGIYGPFRALWVCNAYGIAGIATNSWSWFNCVRDTYGDYWLWTV